jgi:glycosyltransferase involved in cell wall biosynthesis
MAHISVVTPVYRAEGCLEELYRRLAAALSGITQDFEIVMVEDCGGDRSWEIIRELARRDARVKGIQFSRNFGQQYGIAAGLDFCDGDWVVVMDSDLQDQPEDIPRLYAKAQEGFDVVVGKRGRRAHHAVRRLASRLFYRIFSYLTDMQYEGDEGNFRIMSRKVVTNLRRFRERLRFFAALVHWMGFRTGAVEIAHAERKHGKSTYTTWMLFRLGVDTIIAYSDKPLRLCVQLGFLIALGAFAYGVWIIILALMYAVPVTGWSSLIVSIYFIGGIIIAILGVMGIYLGRTFDEARRRPLYIVSNTTFSGEDESTSRP